MRKARVLDAGDIQRLSAANTTCGLAAGITPSTSANDFGRLNLDVTNTSSQLKLVQNPRV
ncbi:MAG: hypothetical protein QE267_06740 [Akkermansiaceae bacterium]|nr:hypothetical protein [Akkermansiaceae bacterium]